MKKKFTHHVLLCLIGILINLIGARVAINFQLPLFLDCLGTIGVAATGGLLPGIVVGFLTNFINCLSDPVTIYYSCINVMVAVCSSYYSAKGYFRKFPDILIVILWLTLLGGGVGSIITWNLYGGGIGEGISAPLATMIYDSHVMNMFFSQLCADICIDLVDKSISVLAVSFVLLLLPDSLMSGLSSYGLSDVGRNGSEHIKLDGISLGVKVRIIITVLGIIITTAVTGASYKLYHDSIIAEESKVAYGLTNISASCFDPEKVDDYMQMEKTDPEYAASLRMLSAIAESDEDISYVYVYQIQPDGCHVVFDPDTEDTPGADPGEVVPFDESFSDQVPLLLAGQSIDPIITNDTFGWLLTVYQPIYNSDGVCKCYIGVDMAMSDIISNEQIFVTKVISLFVSFFILAFTFGAWAADKSIVTPINALAKAVGSFSSDSEESRNESMRRLEALDIHTKDEIEHLYHSAVYSTNEIVKYISHSQKQSEQIATMQNNLIMILADLVESRDKCTGNHIKNTSIYTKMILEKMKEQGIYADQLTDQFIDDVVSGAPLHDVGKIHISDVLLNKPGKLTDEEFETMKTHTTSGGEIIENAIEMMGGDGYSSYLAEAKNLTLYHHEKWNGTGYPTGLKGYDIPLSARIMAVADVFDALVARRSYKPGFPFEKAVAIIKEESGTHFDPKIVDAFLLCLDEARVVAEEANEKSKNDY
jgi:HD-GYP domain-containing protein (c-di-GMP phosphodiesterase class II)